LNTNYFRIKTNIKKKIEEIKTLNREYPISNGKRNKFSRNQQFYGSSVSFNMKQKVN